MYHLLFQKAYKMKYGIAFTENGSPTGRVLAWRKDCNNKDETWDSCDDALEANDRGGWTGYVRCYPSGELIS